MNRRLGRPEIPVLLRRVLSLVQEDGVEATMLAIIDGKISHTKMGTVAFIGS